MLQSDRSRGGNGKGPVASLDQCPEAVATASSRWKKGNTRVKLGAVQIMARSHQEAKKRIESKQDFSASAELDTIKSISKWLSIKVCRIMAEVLLAFTSICIFNIALLKHHSHELLLENNIIQTQCMFPDKTKSNQSSRIWRSSPGESHQ